ncbi:ATPase with role in protein import into the ER [Tulasnella sp. UAMH 9824]|nr:ATPase with role in protein import into the ER [Tulasnella sp. UAMH 9824]
MRRISPTCLSPLQPPEEISAIALGKMKQTAEAYLGEKVTHAVDTVPAYFNDAQRRPPKTPVPSPVSLSSVSSTNPPPPHRLPYQTCSIPFAITGPTEARTTEAASLTYSGRNLRHGPRKDEADRCGLTSAGRLPRQSSPSLSPSTALGIGHKGRGTLAGLTILRIVNEPTAAATTYGLDKKNSRGTDEFHIIVYDLGGETIITSL